MTAFLVLLGAYLVGSIPSGLLLARRVGIDVRRVGSGNIGATNVTRAAGTRLGALTLVADALKGAAPVLVARALGDAPWLPAGAALGAFLGHVFPITLGFRGGKGVATALGALLALAPGAMPPPLVVFVVTLAASGYVSLASSLAAVAAPLAVGLLGYPLPVTGAAAVMAGVILVRHRENFRRLLAGVEPSARLHKKQAPPGK